MCVHYKNECLIKAKNFILKMNNKEIVSDF